jgi:hypothetical protein
MALQIAHYGYVMEDGKIVREDHIGSPVEEDLKMWRYSGLGRRIVTDDPQTEALLGLSDTQLKTVQELLKKAEGSPVIEQ